MKRYSILLLGISTMIFSTPMASPQSQQQQTQKEIFSIKGILTKLSADHETVHLKNEGGLELTFFIVATTEIREGEESKLFANLVVGDKAEVEYIYNENYEKIARLIRKIPIKEVNKPVSS